MPNGLLQMTEQGAFFVEQQQSELVAQIDGYEGSMVILRLLAERGPGKRSVYLPRFTAFCQTHTTFNSESVIKSTMYDRMANLIDRGLVFRSGQSYGTTDDGLAYLAQYGQQYVEKTQPLEAAVEMQLADIRKLSQQIRLEARQQLHAYLAVMNPYKFEELVQHLLEEMGYTDVQTTTPSNDKGIDVIGDIELGISSVREVIQVKRMAGNINRPVLDQLRGSLHRFDAVRGTIITTGGFSKGTEEAAFERGVAPITLIDGEKLLDLLFEYGIGVTKQTVNYYEFDAASLSQFADEVDEEDELTL